MIVSTMQGKTTLPLPIFELVLTTIPKRRFQLLQTSVAIFVMAAGLVGLTYLEVKHIARRTDVDRWALFAVPGWFMIFAAIRSGLTSRLADPAMTIWQMGYGIACCAGAYAITGAARGAVFPLLMSVLIFNVFSLTLKQLGIVIVGTLVLFAATMAKMSQLRPDVYPATIEQIHFWMLAAMMPVMFALASQLSKVRMRLKERTAALEISLERNRILATRDELTGLINRRQLLELVERDHLRSARSHTGYCVALIDLDHFKAVNDRYGHATGDTVLKEFAREAVQHIRGADALGRWGGEEFLLLLPDTVIPAACESLYRLRRRWLDHRLDVRGERLHQTFSAGLVQHRPGDTIEQTIERADKALYRAKAQGRDQVVFED